MLFPPMGRMIPSLGNFRNKKIAHRPLTTLRRSNIENWLQTEKATLFAACFQPFENSD